MDYATVKLLHQTAVVLSIAGFAARFGGVLAGAAWTQGRLAKRLPHVVDTVLLASAVTLAWMLRLNPLHAPWLAAKIGGLLLYIALGMVALNPRRPHVLRRAAGAAAMTTVAWIASVALSKNPAGFLDLA